jgi:hypothetical protein
MSIWLQLETETGAMLNFPTRQTLRGFQAMSTATEGTAIVSVCLASDETGPIARIGLADAPFTLEDEEHGIWTITFQEYEFGLVLDGLQYYATNARGRKLRTSAVFQFDFDREEIVAD